MNATGPQYLRLSVTARCNLACVYCRSGGQAVAQDELTVGDLRFVVACAAAEGVRKVRITGGEPLQRADLEEVVAAVRSVRGVREIGLTTNGIGLAGRLPALKRAGLDRVNVSLDSLRPEMFARLTGADPAAHPEVLEAIAAAAETCPPAKINAVMLAGRNDREPGDFVRLGGRLGVRVRFIEYYGPPAGAEDCAAVPPDEVMRRITEEFGEVLPVGGDPLSVEEVYQVPALGDATFGLVRSASGPPCARCNKLRLTAAGVLLPCLFAARGKNLWEEVRRRDEAAVRRAVRDVYAAKERSGPAGRTVACTREIGG